MAGQSCQITTSAFRHFHAGVAVAASIGGYLFFLLSRGGWPVIVAGTVALIIATGAGIAFDALLLAKLRLDGVRTLGLFLISLAGWLVVQSLISILIGNEIHGILVEDRKAWQLLSAVITRKQVYVIALSTTLESRGCEANYFPVFLDFPALPVREYWKPLNLESPRRPAFVFGWLVLSYLLSPALAMLKV